MEKSTSGSEGEREAAAEHGNSAGENREAADERTRRERLTDAINAFWESLEETIAETRDRGDAAEGKARELLRAATERARTATAEAREKFDFVTHDQFEDLAARVARLEARMADRVGESADIDDEDSRRD